MRKHFLLYLASILILSGCVSNDFGFTSTNSVYTDSLGVESSDISTSNDSVESSDEKPDNPSSTSSKIAFEAPLNARIEGTTFRWDSVDNAINGYRIRINDTFLKDVYTNSYDILSDENNLIRGINTFSVRVNGTDDFYISPYTLKNEFIYGANETRSNEFVELVSSLGEITLGSYDALAQGKAKYETLDEIDRLLPTVKNAYLILSNKDGEYLKLLVNEVLNASEENRNASINNARAYYDKLLDKNASTVKEALNISINSNVTYQMIHQNIEEAKLFIYAYGENIIGELLSQMAPVVKYNNVDISLNGQDGIYYTTINHDVEIYYNEQKIADVSYLEAQDGSTFGITDGLSFGATSTMDIDHFMIKIYRSDDVIFEDGEIILLGNYLAAFNTNSNPFREKNIYNALALNGYLNKSIEYRFMVEAISSDNHVSMVTIQSFSEIRTIDIGELKLSSPAELETNEDFQPKIKDNGDLDYRFEIIDNNDEWKNGDIAYLELMMYDASLDFDGEDTPFFAIMKITKSGFIYEKDIIHYLKSNQIYGSLNIKMAMRFIPSENSAYSPSDYTLLKNSYTYEINNRLSTYGDIYIDQSNGRLVWPWEIFKDEYNIEANYVSHIEVLIFSSDIDKINEAQVLSRFIIDYRNGDIFTYKKNIEQILKDNSLSSGSYRFAIKLIAFKDSPLKDSDFYPMTESYYYSVEE